MTLDASIPANSAFASSIPALDREVRAYVNSLEAALGALGAIVTWSEVDIAGVDTLVVGVDVGDVPIEVIHIDAGAAASLTTITGARQGQIKILLAEGNNVTVTYNAGTMELMGAADLGMQANDSLWIVNVGGDPATLANGVWYEINRNLWV